MAVSGVNLFTASQHCSGQCRGDRNRDDQADGSHQHPHNLHSHNLATQNAADRLVALAKEQHQRKRSTCIGQHQSVHRRSHVIAAYGDGFSVQHNFAHLWVGSSQRRHCRYLGDRDIVEHAEGANHDARY